VEAEFAAAHYLERYHGKCERLHGHNYRVLAYARGDALDEGGMLLDFGELKVALREVLAKLDHRCLNEIPALGACPSAELIARFVFEGIVEILPRAPLSAVEVFETATSMARYEP
jgi:6-pyruvoyltetrahydropterin/6-carboxytetrahydropterin synthase